LVVAVGLHRVRGEIIFLDKRVITVTKTYRVVLLGRIEEKQDFEEKMEKLVFSSGSVRDLIEKVPSALKAGLPLGEAREYAEAVQEAGGKVNIQEDGVSDETKRLHPPIEIRSLKDFTMCPECGHRQLKADACVKCGFLFFQKKEKRSAR
jgi:ribosomal protein L32